jgi:hypothetical protein
MAVVTKDQAFPITEACHWHPEVQTGLHCNQCGRAICPKCARPSPVGYKCAVCVRGIIENYFNGKPWDYVIAIAITLPFSLLTAALLSFAIWWIGWFPWFIVLLAAPTVAGFIAEAVRHGVRRRRSRYLALVVAGCFVAAIVPFLAAPLVVGSLLHGGLGIVLYRSGLLELGILLVVGTTTIMARLR